LSFGQAVGNNDIRNRINAFHRSGDPCDRPRCGALMPLWAILVIAPTALGIVAFGVVIARDARH